MDTDSCIIRGGTVVCADRVLPDCDVVVIDGRIAAIEPVGASDFDAQPDATMGVLPVVDARGAYVAPGLIDIHSDYVENVASPRPSVVMDLSTSLYKADRELVSHGVTTIFHSLSVYGAHVFDHKPIRDFGNVSALIDRVAALRAGEERDHLIRHRLHMRVELDSVDLYDDIESFLRSGKVDLVSFMDHTPGQGQYRDLLVFGDTLKGYRDVSDEDVRDIVRQQQESQKLTYAQITALAAVARERGVSIASHDDDSEDKLAFMDGLEATISEFPISLDIARAARARGMHTIAGAPNVMLGHSHSGNLSARGRAGRRHRRAVQRLLPGGAAGRGVHAARSVRARHRESVRAGHYQPGEGRGHRRRGGLHRGGQARRRAAGARDLLRRRRRLGRAPGRKAGRSRRAHDARGHARVRGRPLGVPLALSRPAARLRARHRAARLARPADPPSGQGGVAWRSSESTACPKPSCSIA